jgi:hypothetical protein
LNIQKKITEVKQSAEVLLEIIENEAWDEANELCQQWDTKIRIFFNELSSEEIIAARQEIEEIAVINVKIKNCIIQSRAKVLTQLQKNNTSRTVIQLYKNS